MATKSEKILSKFNKARQKRQEKDQLWKDLDAFDRGDQWEMDGSIPPFIPKPVTNFIHLVKTTKRAALAIKNPTGKLYPQSPNDVQKAEDLQEIYEFVWDKAKARKTVREVIETGKLLGTGIAQVYWDENTGVLGGTGGKYEGEVRVKQIDPASFYPDPTAFSIDTCEFIHIVERKPVAWIKSHPIFGKNAKNLDSRAVAENERGEIYHRDYSTQTDGMIDFHQHYEKVANENGGFRYKVTYLAGETVVHEIEDLKPRCYPFAVYYDYPQRQDFWGVSTCQLILDNQKLINKVESIIAMIGTLLQNPVKVVSKRSGINPKEAAKYGHAPGHTFLSNDDPASSIHWQQPPQIPPSLFSLAEQAKENIREITGLNDAYTGQSVGSLQTSSGVNSLIDRATMRDRDQMYDVELFVEDLSKKIIMFATEYYQEKRFMRILDSDGNVNFKPFIGTDYKDLEYDIDIDVSAKAPLTRMKQKEEAKELLNMQGQYQYDPAIITPQEYIKLGEFSTGDQIIERMNHEEVMNKTQMLSQVLTMMNEAEEQGLPPQEVQKMAYTMIDQKLNSEGKGIGSTNSSSFQQRQGGV